MLRLPKTRLRRASGWVAGGIVGRYVAGAWNLRRTLAWVDQPVPIVSDVVEATDIAVHFVVPVLREQQHIPATIAWFAHLLEQVPGSTLTIVTTAREEREREHLVDRLVTAKPSAITPGRFPQLTQRDIAELNAIRASTRGGALTCPAVAGVLAHSPLTSQVVDELLARPGYVGLPIRHAHYPGDGRKAAQVNYAVSGLLLTPNHGYVAVYDVDSRPSAELLRRTIAFLSERRLTDGEPPPVLQQSARFITRGTSCRRWERVVCRGAARLQTLWTLRREIPSFRRYAWGTRHRTETPLVDALLRGLAQTVGHGVLIRLDVFHRMGGLPTDTVLEDFPFGYRLTINGISVECLPFTTMAPAPEDVRELLAQGRRWFQNYLDYPRCAATARAAGHGTATTRAVALGIGCYRGATWLLRSPSVVVCAALLAGRWPWPVRAAVAAGLYLDVVLPVRMLARADGHSPSLRHCVQDCLVLLLAYLLTSAGPLTAVVHRLFSGSPGSNPITPKTEHRSQPASLIETAIP